MPRRPPKYCRKAGCNGLARDGKQWCGDCLANDQGAYNKPPGEDGYGKDWKRLRLLVLEDQPYCAAFRCCAAAVDVDHILPKRKGGTDARSNLQGLCRSCHSKKTQEEKYT